MSSKPRRASENRPERLCRAKPTALDSWQGGWDRLLEKNPRLSRGFLFIRAEGSHSTRQPQAAYFGGGSLETGGAVPSSAAGSDPPFPSANFSKSCEYSFSSFIRPV